MNRRRALKTLFCSSAAFSLNLRMQAEAAVAPEAIHLLAIGDFGTGGQDQKAVAKAMQTFVTTKSIKPQGLWFIGDNFYGRTKLSVTGEDVTGEITGEDSDKKKEGKKSKDGKEKEGKKKKEEKVIEEMLSLKSRRWKEQVEDMYPASVFPGPQWAVLGNHDYHDNEGGEKVQLEYAKQPGVRWHMPNKWYRVDVGTPKPLVTFLALDTNLPTVSGTKSKKTGKKQAHLALKDEVAQLAWLKEELAKPRAPFTVVVGHHPLYSNGIHKDTKQLIEQWGELFEEHKVHAYLCGHDHDLQHLELENRFTSFILSGGGGARVRKLTNETRKMPYGHDINGFTHLQIQADALTFTHHGVDGGVLHRFTKKQDGTVVI